MPPATDAWPGSIGLVGAGAMGRAFAAGMLRGRPDLAERLLVTDAIPDAVAAGVADAGGRPAHFDEAASADLVCVAVKPGDAGAALERIRAAAGADATVLSVVAGWDLDRLEAALPHTGLVRTMPNLAVRHGAGVVALATRGLDEGREAAVRHLLAPLGAVVPLPESLFSAATALAGTAALLADGTDPALLRQRVSSPAGTTIAGVAVLERGAVRAHVADAVLAAANRAAGL